MIQLFKYLKDAGWTVGLIVLLLIVQAWCDLSLPTYTSDIVDVGIQQGGIAYAVPYRMRGETLRELEAYMTPDQIAVLEGAYTQEADGSYTLADRSTEELERLEGLLEKPILALSRLQAISETYGLEPPERAPSGGPDPGSGLALLEALPQETETLSRQKTVLFVRQEYQALGMDLGALQTRYLLATGGRMLPS